MFNKQTGVYKDLYKILNLFAYFYSVLVYSMIL
jgi:hypothetical protein